MALSPTQTSMANQLVQKFSVITGPVDAAKGGVKSLTRTLTSQLSTATFSPPGSITAELDSINTQVSDLLPGTTEEAMEDLKNFIDNCPFYGSDTNPVSTIYGTRDVVFDQIDNLMNASTLEEIVMANLADAINKLLNGLGFPNGNDIANLLAQADKLIDCLSAIPGYDADVIAFGNEVSDLYTEMNIISNPLDPLYGQLDYSTIYSNAGIDASAISNMNTAIAGITNIKSNSLTSITDSANAAKSYLSGGFF